MAGRQKARSQAPEREGGGQDESTAVRKARRLLQQPRDHRSAGKSEARSAGRRRLHMTHRRYRVARGSRSVDSDGRQADVAGICHETAAGPLGHQCILSPTCIGMHRPRLKKAGELFGPVSRFSCVSTPQLTPYGPSRYGGRCGHRREIGTLPATPAEAKKENEGAGTRTQDLRIKSPLLYRLSYAFIAPHIPGNGRAREGRTIGAARHRSNLAVGRGPIARATRNRRNPFRSWTRHRMLNPVHDHSAECHVVRRFAGHHPDRTIRLIAR